MSPIGDLALSPGDFECLIGQGIFFSILQEILVFGFVVALGIHRDCTVIEREDAVHLGGVPDWDFCRRFELRF